MATGTGELLRIGEVARRCQVSPRTLRYYEEVGLLRPTAATEGGFRLYSEEAAARVERIIRLKECLNFSLEEVREVIEADDRLATLKEESRRTEDPRRRLEVLDSILEVIGRQRQIVRSKRAQLDAVLEELDGKAARCRSRRAELAAQAKRGARPR